MQLWVHELQATGYLYQQITVGTRDIQLYAIRPHIMKFAAPAGSLTMRILDTNGKIIDSSETLAISSVLTGLGTWPHGYQRFLISTELKANTIYRIALVASAGYAFSESAYIGWANDYDFRRVTASYTPSFGPYAALDTELWVNEDTPRRVA